MGLQVQRDTLTLRLELKGEVSQEGFSQAVQKSIQDRCRVRADTLDFVAPGTIPESEKKVKDTRTWE